MKKIISLVCAFVSIITIAQNKPLKDVNLDQLISDTQYTNDSTDDIEIIWWLPTEYWQSVFAQDESSSQAESDMIVEMLENYTLTIVIKGKVGMFGGVTFTPREIIENELSVNYNGVDLKLVAEDKLSPDLVNFLSVIKPMMKNMLGPMGENMQVFLFENKKGSKYIKTNPRSEGELTFRLDTYSKNVDLPLGSLIMEKVCPQDNTLHTGKWTYCPYHGAKLEPQK